MATLGPERKDNLSKAVLNCIPPAVLLFPFLDTVGFFHIRIFALSISQPESLLPPFICLASAFYLTGLCIWHKASWLGKSVMADLFHLQSITVWILLGFHSVVCV